MRKPIRRPVIANAVASNVQASTTTFWKASCALSLGSSAVIPCVSCRCCALTESRRGNAGIVITCRAAREWCARRKTSFQSRNPKVGVKPVTLTLCLLFVFAGFGQFCAGLGELPGRQSAHVLITPVTAVQKKKHQRRARRRTTRLQESIYCITSAKYANKTKKKQGLPHPAPNLWPCACRL